jgi:hypothetical protein
VFPEKDLLGTDSKRTIWVTKKTFICTRTLVRLGGGNRHHNTFSYKGELARYDKVKSKATDEFYQVEDRIKHELIPANWDPPYINSKGKQSVKTLSHYRE